MVFLTAYMLPTSISRLVYFWMKGHDENRPGSSQHQRKCPMYGLGIAEIGRNQSSGNERNIVKAIYGRHLWVYIKRAINFRNMSYFIDKFFLAITLTLLDGNLQAEMRIILRPPISSPTTSTIPRLAISIKYRKNIQVNIGLTTHIISNT